MLLLNTGYSFFIFLHYFMNNVAKISLFILVWAHMVIGHLNLSICKLSINIISFVLFSFCLYMQFFKHKRWLKLHPHIKSSHREQIFFSLKCTFKRRRISIPCSISLSFQSKLLIPSSQGVSIYFLLSGFQINWAAAYQPAISFLPKSFALNCVLILQYSFQNFLKNKLYWGLLRYNKPHPLKYTIW